MAAFAISAHSAGAQIATPDDCRAKLNAAWQQANEKRIALDPQAGRRARKLAAHIVDACSDGQLKQAENGLGKLTQFIAIYKPLDGKELKARRDSERSKKAALAERVRARRAKYTKTIPLAELTDEGAVTSVATCEARLQSLIDHAREKNIDDEIGAEIEPLGEQIEAACASGDFKKAGRMIVRVANFVDGHKKMQLDEAQMDLTLTKMRERWQKPRH